MLPYVKVVLAGLCLVAVYGAARGQWVEQQKLTALDTAGEVLDVPQQTAETDRPELSFTARSPRPSIDAEFGGSKAWVALDTQTPIQMATFSATTTWNQIESAASERSPGADPSTHAESFLAPPTIVDFRGVLDDGTRIPPDTHGAVGPQHVVSITNAGIQVFNRSGTALTGLATLQSFWSVLGTAPGQPASDVFDSRLLYDQYIGRWLVVADGNPNNRDGTNNSWVVLALSQTDDPTLGWNMFAIRANIISNHPNDWADFPGLGVDPDNVILSNNFFTVAPAPSFVHADVWVINKASLLAGTPLVEAVDYALLHDPCGIGGATRQPCHTYGQSSGTAVNYLLDQGWVDSLTRMRRFIRMHSITGTGAGAVLNCLGGAFGGFIEVAQYNVNLLDAPQLSCVTALETNTTHLSANAVWRNGKVWMTHGVGAGSGITDAAPPSKEEVAWYELNPSAAADFPGGVPIQQGRVSDPSRHYYFPSIAVNANECVALGFSGSDSISFAGAYYTLRSSGDPVGTMEPVSLLKGGLGPYWKQFGTTRNRWGDYSATVVDPTDDITFWTTQEYAEAPFLGGGGACVSEGGRWGTWWGKFRCGGCAAAPGPDCNGNGTLDECDIVNCTGAPACSDCNANGIPDECDIATCPGDPACADCNANGVPDECDITPSAAPPPHDRRKNRYISFTPNNGSCNVAFRVDTTANQFFPSCVGQQGWVQTPDANGISRLDVIPVFRVWPEPVIHVGDEEIVPVATYAVFGAAPGPVVNNTPLIVQTIAQPTLNIKCWADTVGSLTATEWTPPNGIVNVSDQLAVLAFIANAAIKPHLTVVDVEPQVPNKIVNVADVNRVFAAIAGAGYPFDLPPCSKVPCGGTVDVGACCLPNGTCQDTQTLGSCSAQGGTFQGDGSTCTPFSLVACAPTGACCLPNFTCVETTEVDCAAQIGDYKDDNTDCANYSCGCDVNSNAIPDSTEISCAVCRTIPTMGLDVLPTGGAFKIIYLDNTQQSLLGLTDANTAFARSDPFNHGGPPEAGAPVTNGGAAPYPDTEALAPEPCVVPPGFPNNPAFGPEIHIEILSLNLSNGADMVRAGQALFNSLLAVGRTDLYENTFGEAQGECIELPGEIYFNAFFEIETGGQKLYNKGPVVLRGEVNDLPIDLDDPGEDFINDPSFPAVALFDQNGVHQAYLVSVAFGGGGGGNLPPSSCESQRAFAAPISFTVDGSSNGILINSPNHVSLNAPEKKVTVYSSSGANNNLPPDTTNARYDTGAANLTGVVGSPPLFNAANDAINSLSFGKDGTVNTAVPGQRPVLMFSVDRTSTGSTCTDVRIEADRVPVEVAADVFIAPAIPVAGQPQSFGQYGGAFVPPCSAGRGSCLVSDQTSLGLRPLFAGIGHDNVTAFEASRFLISDRAYMTFTGPSFNSDANHIYTHDGDSPFSPPNLVSFAPPIFMGLQGADVIDALAVSDVTPGSGTVQPDGIRNAGDEVLFSLAPGSPSLAGSGFSAADILYSNFNNTFTRRYAASAMGLLTTDNVDALDISPGIGTADCNNNGILDQCDIDRGESADADMNGLPDECEGKNRYITFAPNIVYAGDATVDSVAFRVELINNFYTPGATGTIGWVDTPRYQCDFGTNNNQPCTGPAGCPGGSCTIITAKVSPTPVQRQWPETIVHVGDCEIFPVARYRITATTTPPVVPPATPDFQVSTAVKPLGKFWGDVTGQSVDPITNRWQPPNGLCNTADVQAVLARIQNVIKPSFPAANLEAVSAADPCLNPQVNTADVLIVVKAAAGETYPFSTDPFTNVCPPCP